MNAQYAAVTVFYDGECPICSRYASYQRLQQAAATVALVNARDMSLADWQALASAGVDVNDGIVVRVLPKVGSAIIHGGSAAVGFLAQFDERRGLLGSAHRLFRHPRLARLIYPLLYQARRGLLVLLRIPRRISPPR